MATKDSQEPQPTRSQVATDDEAEARFINVADDAGLKTVLYCGGVEKNHILESVGSGCAWIDFDEDGLLDLFLVNAWALDDSPRRVRERGRNALYRNVGQVSSTGGGAGTAGGAGGTSRSGGAIGSGGLGGAGTGTSTGGASGPVTHNEFILHDDDGRLLYVNNSTPARNWATNSGSGRDLQLVGGGRVMLGKSDGWDEYRLSDGTLAGGRHGFAGTQTAHRLADGNTVLASVSGTTITLRFVNAAGQMQRQIAYAGFTYVRCVRQTATGTFMVAAGTVIFEGNDQGNVLWQAPVPNGRNLFKAMRMSNGNVVAASGYGATLVVFNPAHAVIQTIGGKTQPNAAQLGPWFYADYHVMPNGNYFMVNSMADTTNNSSVQLLEYNPAGALVWQQKQPASVRSLESAIVLDGLDLTKLHVEPEGRLIPVP